MLYQSNSRRVQSRCAIVSKQRETMTLTVEIPRKLRPVCEGGSNKPMTLILELAPEIEARLRAKAQQRGLSLDAYLLELAERDEPSTPAKVTAASVRGKYAQPNGPTVDDFLAERRAEGQVEEAAFQRQQTGRRDT